MDKLRSISLSKKIATFRIGFGLIWAIDAAFKFEPAFFRGHNLLTFVMSKDAGEPGWLNPWFHMWYRIFGANPELFAIIILIAEVLIALSLLLGIARRLNYLLAIPFCFLIWSIGEAFGGPYVAGTTDINAGFIYVMVFISLYLIDGLVSPSWSLDPTLSRHISWWKKIASPPNAAKRSTS